MEELLAEVSRDHFPHPPATLEEIRAFEEQVGWRLDSDLRAFYLHCNGAELFEPLPDCPYRLLPLSKIVRARMAIFGRDEDRCGPASQYALCDVGDGDYVLVDTSRQFQGRYPLIDGWHERWPDPANSKLIAASFAEFLEGALRSNGLQFYLQTEEPAPLPKTSSRNAYGPLLAGSEKPNK